MTNSQSTPGIVPNRLSGDAYGDNFSDLHPPLNAHEALVAADRCYFCHDAPCMTACPTSIDIPLFIRQIQTDTPEAAAKTILAQNIMGGMCARVCPTETLCEEVCVRETAEGEPVQIGRLQRYATDTLMAQGVHPFSRAASTGKRIAIVGAGPAGLACAHRLAMHGHDVVVFDARAKAGGLNEFGIATYKSVDDFAAQEVDWLLKIGGITIETGKALKAKEHGLVIGVLRIRFCGDPIRRVHIWLYANAGSPHKRYSLAISPPIDAYPATSIQLSRCSGLPAMRATFSMTIMAHTSSSVTGMSR